MSEEKNVNTVKDPFDDTGEPIDSIERTVEDLKKMIRNLEKNQEETEKEVEEKPETQLIPEFFRNKENLQKMKEDTTKAVNDAITTIKEAAAEKSKDVTDAIAVVKEKVTEQLNRSEINEKDAEVNETADDIKEESTEYHDDVKSSVREKVDELSEKTKELAGQAVSMIKDTTDKIGENEDVQKTIAYIKKNASKAYDSAMVKVDELKHDPKIREFSDKAEDALQKTRDYVEPKTKKLVNQAKEFIGRPDVQERFSKAKDTAKDLFSSVISKAKELTAKKPEQK